MGQMHWREFYAVEVLEIYWHGVVGPDELVAEKQRLVDGLGVIRPAWRVVSDYQDCELVLDRIQPIHYATAAMVDGMLLSRFPGARWAAVMRPQDFPEGSRWLEVMAPARSLHQVDGRLFLARRVAWDWLSDCRQLSAVFTGR